MIEIKRIKYHLFIFTLVFISININASDYNYRPHEIPQANSILGDQSDQLTLLTETSNIGVSIDKISNLVNASQSIVITNPRGNLDKLKQVLKELGLIEIDIVDMQEKIRWIGGNKEIIIAGDILFGDSDESTTPLEMFDFLEKLRIVTQNGEGTLKIVIGNNEIESLLPFKTKDLIRLYIRKRRKITYSCMEELDSTIAEQLNRFLDDLKKAIFFSDGGAWSFSSVDKGNRYLITSSGITALNKEDYLDIFRELEKEERFSSIPEYQDIVLQKEDPQTISRIINFLLKKFLTSSDFMACISPDHVEKIRSLNLFFKNSPDGLRFINHVPSFSQIITKPREKKYKKRSAREFFFHNGRVIFTDPGEEALDEGSLDSENQSMSILLIP